MSSTGEKIIEASLKLFARKGFEATSIRDIALEANINSATLYYYIKNKVDFLFSLMQIGLEESLSYAKEIISTTKAPEKKITSLVQMHVMIHGEKQLLTFVTDTEYRSLQGEHKAIIRDLRKKYEEVWTSVIKSGIAEGIFKGVKDPNLTSIALLEMCTGVAHWYSPNGRVPLVNISEEFATMALNLLGARRDGEKINLEDLDLQDPTKYIKAENNDYKELLKH